MHAEQLALSNSVTVGCDIFRDLFDAYSNLMLISLYTVVLLIIDVIYSVKLVI